MTFTEILTSDKSTRAKLNSLNTLITKIRTEYGNETIEIDMPEVNSADGFIPLSYLDDESKLVIAERTIKYATIATIEMCKEEQGKVFDREFESIIATSPVLCNLTIGTNSKYL